VEVFVFNVLSRRFQIALLLILIICSCSFTDISSQNLDVKPSRQSSMEAFSNGKYDIAYDQFNELLTSYPKDPLYKYYSGVCLVKLNRNPERASELLQQSLQVVAAARNVPTDAVFYLGRAQQMAGRFSDAIESYKRFENLSGKKVAKELGVPEFVQQCNIKVGKLITSEPASPGKVEKEINMKPPKEVVPVRVDKRQQTINNPASSKSKLPQDYEILLDEALDFQFKADSLTRIANSHRSELDSLPSPGKSATRNRIQELETLSGTYQMKADAKFSEAENLKNSKSFDTKSAVIQTDTQRKITAEKDSVVKQVPIAESGIIKDSILKADSKKSLNKNNPKTEIKAATDSVRPAPPVNMPNSGKSDRVEVYSVFEVLTKPVVNNSDKIPVDSEVPEGLTYRIQVAVFRNPVLLSYFKGISPVYGFKVQGSDRTGYYAGLFRRSADASKALNAVKARGFKDAFVTAFSGSKIISAERAAILEKEWGKKPFFKNMSAASLAATDTLAPALIFRVEVLRSQKPVKEEMAVRIKKIAGNRGLDIQNADDGKIVYLIGKFITFGSAAEYSDLLVRNGFREAKVVAWLGNKEIPVEKAKQLFEQLE
jgi:tetratricopeptide (TPR) repeat protein